MLFEFHSFLCFSPGWHPGIWGLYCTPMALGVGGTPYPRAGLLCPLDCWLLGNYWSLPAFWVICWWHLWFWPSVLESQSSCPWWSLSLDPGPLPSECPHWIPSLMESHGCSLKLILLAISYRHCCAITLCHVGMLLWVAFPGGLQTPVSRHGKWGFSSLDDLSFPLSLIHLFQVRLQWEGKGRTQWPESSFS